MQLHNLNYEELLVLASRLRTALEIIQISTYEGDTRKTAETALGEKHGNVPA